MVDVEAPAPAGRSSSIRTRGSNNGASAGSRAARSRCRNASSGDVANAGSGAASERNDGRATQVDYGEEDAGAIVETVSIQSEATGPR